MIMQQHGNLVWATYTDKDILENEQGFAIYLEQEGKRQYLDIVASECGKTAYRFARDLFRQYKGRSHP